MTEYEIRGIQQLLAWALTNRTPEVLELVPILRNILAKYDAKQTYILN